MPEATSILDDRRNRGVGEYGCAHYRRRAKLVAPCWCVSACDEARMEMWWLACICEHTLL